ncbi:MAG: YkvA family protein [Anaerolineae bacterium]
MAEREELGAAEGPMGITQLQPRPVRGATDDGPAVASKLRTRIEALETETLALYHAYRDPRVSPGARIAAAVVAAYALSPIDLIPDFIPVLGYLDDLVVVPLGLWLVLRMIPPEVMADARARAAAGLEEGSPTVRAGVAIVIVLWGLALALAAWIVWRATR